MFAHGIRHAHSAPVPRLWGANEAHQDAPASRRASGDLGVLLLALQTGGDKGAGTDCRVKPSDTKLEPAKGCWRGFHVL